MKPIPAEELGAKALDMLRRLDMDTCAIAEVTGWAENIVVMAMDEERDNEANRHRRQQPDAGADRQDGRKVAAV